MAIDSILRERKRLKFGHEVPRGSAETGRGRSEYYVLRLARKSQMSGLTDLDHIGSVALANCEDSVGGQKVMEALIAMFIRDERGLETGDC